LSDARANSYLSFSTDVGLVAGVEVGKLLLVFVRLPLLTKLLGAEHYGTLSLVLVTAALLAPAAALGLGAAVVRFLAAENTATRVRDRFFSATAVVLLAGAALCLAVILTADFLESTVYGGVDASAVIRLGAFLIVTEALNRMTQCYFRAFRRMGWFATMNVALPVLELALMAGFLALGWGLRGVIIGMLIAGVVTAVTSLSVVAVQVGVSVPRFAGMGRYLRYGIPLIPSRPLNWVINYSDRYMLGYFLGAAQVGLYSAAYGITNVISVLATPVGMVLFPTVARLYDQGKTEETKTYFRYSIKYVLMLSIPAAVGLSVLSVPLIRLFTSEEFVDGAAIVPLVAGGLVAAGLRQLLDYIFHLVNKTFWVMLLLGIAAVLNVLLNLLLIPPYGIMGAAIATTAAFVVVATVTGVVGFRYLRIDMSPRFLAKSVVASAAMGAAIWAVSPSGLLAVAASIILGAIGYFAVLFLLRGFSRTEIAFLRSLLASLVPARLRRAP